MKVLMSAYACCPGRGSEPCAGWNWALQMARWHEVWVITRPSNREPIEAELMREPQPSLHFSYVDVPGQAKRWWGLGYLFGWAGYYLWQYLAFRKARKLHAEVRFDLVHHTTYGTWRVPSFLWKLGAPFVWGSVGGGQLVPSGFHRTLGFWGVLKELVRNTLQWALSKDPFLLAMRREAAAVLVNNRETATLLANLPGCRTVLMPFAGTTSIQDGARGRESPPARLHLLWAGRLVPWKGLTLMLEALRCIAWRSSDIEVQFHVAGQGPDLSRLERIAKVLGLSHIVKFEGWMTQEALMACYREADVFIFTSLRESFGMVVVDAMAAGLPIICLDHGGPSLIANQECAIMIEPRSEAYVIEKLAEAIKTLACDPELRRRMGEAGRRRAEREFSWNILGEKMNAIYREVAGE
jgi:glycosyltransferase involved in cell wall biosynthesis